MTDIRVYGPNDMNAFPFSGLGEFRAVQHQQHTFFDAGDDSNQRMTTYTGTLPVQHGAEDDDAHSIFEYPLLGIFGPGEQLGIFPISDPLLNPTRPQFRSAVADAAASTFRDKDDGRVGVRKVRADLFEIILDKPSTILHAVVLRGEVDSMETHIFDISFRVSVLERIREPKARAPILFGSGWNGNYNLTNDGHVGQMVLPGVPQR